MKFLLVILIGLLVSSCSKFKGSCYCDVTEYHPADSTYTWNNRDVWYNYHIKGNKCNELEGLPRSPNKTFKGDYIIFTRCRLLD
jgi:hypothetical protein